MNDQTSPIILNDVSLHPAARAALEALGEVRDRKSLPSPVSLGDFDAVVAYGVPFSSDDLAGASRLKVITCHSCPPDVRATAEELGISVHELASLWDTVADMTIALLLSAARRLPQADRAIRAGRWGREDLKIIFSGNDVTGRTLGIVGLGRIGSRVARRMRGFDMRILYADIARDHGLEPELGLEFVPLEELASQSDYVAVLVPLIPETEGLISADVIARMKPDALLINTSRGRVLDTDALIEALQARRIGGAALDVLPEEPIPQTSPLLTLDNVILTPHLGGSTKESDLALIAPVLTAFRS